MSHFNPPRRTLHLKPLVLASLVFTALACATLPSRAQTPAPAQPAAQMEGPRAQRGMERPHRADPARREAHREARMAQRAAELKARLQIQPAQDTAWSNWTASMKPPAGLRENMAKNREEMQKLSTPERIERMKTLRTQRDAEIDKRAQATKEFYAQLSTEQKKIFDSQPPMGPRGGGHRGQHGHGPMQGRS